MAELRNEEIRRLIGYLRKIVDEEKLVAIEEEIRGADGAEFIREPEFLTYFSFEMVEIENWRLRIIPYTTMRMIQRGIGQEAVINLFRQFIEFCQKTDEVIIVGAYTLFGKVKTIRKAITLRIDVDKISDETGEAHTVTVFVGSGNAENTIFLSLAQ